MLSRGNYRIDVERYLGDGSFGVVHPATHKYGRKVAAKRINSKDESRLVQIAEDVKKQLRQNHRNIARVLDVILEGNSVWVLIELCEHGDLVNYLKP